MKLKRDNYLDFYRGIGVFGIIFIHTVFHSGEAYVPAIFRTFALLLDVPFFFYLAGWSFNYSNNIKNTFFRLTRLFLQWILFIVLINFILILIGRNDFKNTVEFFKAIFFKSYPDTTFPSLAWSIWYLRAYYKVLIIGCVLINYIDFTDVKNKYIILLLLLLIIFYNSIGGEVFDRETSFYLFFFFVGFLSRPYEITKFKYMCFILITILALWYILSKMFALPAKDLQSLKFPPHIIYCVASLISIIISLYLKGKINLIVENGFVRYIGKNALCFYFSQGIGGSLLFYILPKINFSWSFKLIIALFINFIISLIIAVILIRIYMVYNKILNLIMIQFSLLIRKCIKRDN